MNPTPSATTSETIEIGPRFCGPAGSANGGYTCGLVAQLLGGTAEVTLHAPPPLSRPLRVERADGGVRVLDGEQVVASAAPAELELELPDPVEYAVAERAIDRYPGLERHPFPTCFVCGPERARGEALRIFASPIPGRAVVAAPWVPAPDLAGKDGLVRDEFLWAALDCPGGFAVGYPERGEMLLGRLAAVINRRPHPGERLVAMGWQLGEERRKLYAGTALFSERGEVLALARATWIAPRGD